MRGLCKRHDTFEIEDIENVVVLKRQLNIGNHVLEASINHKFRELIQQKLLAGGADREPRLLRVLN